MKVFKKWFTKQSKVVLTPENTSTRLFSLYGETNSLEQIKSKIREIENTLNNLPEIPQLPDLRNYAVKNADNNFTTSQTIQGHLNSNGLYKVGARQNIVQIKNQGAKEASIVFEQNNAGFRNYSYFNIMHKYSNTNEVKLFSLYTKNTNEGIFMLCENNKLTFENDTTIDNIATPTTDKQAATKKYVDDKVASIPTPPQVDLSNVAMKNQPNQFTAQQDMTLIRVGQGELLNVTGLPNSLVNKQYVDSKTSLSKIYRKYFGSGSVNINKYDGPSGWYRYSWWTYITNRDFANKDVLVFTKTQSLGSGDNRTSTNSNNSWNTDNTYLFTADANGRVQVSGDCFSTVDLKYGGTGNFTGNFNAVECYLMVVEKVQL